MNERTDQRTIDETAAWGTISRHIGRKKLIFHVIDIPDYTPEEKKAIFQRFALPKVLKRMGLKDDECIMTDEALDAVIEMYSETTGIRDLEQAAEHIAANALYQIEVHHMNSVTFDGAMVRNLLL